LRPGLKFHALRHMYASLCALFAVHGSRQGDDHAGDLHAARTLEPMTGIEPAYSAWEADVLPLNYIGLFDWRR
jgi:hypothetical protein